MAEDAPSVTFTAEAFKSGGKFLFSLLEVENIPELDETGETQTYFRIRVAGNPTRKTATLQNSDSPCHGEGSDFVFTGGVGSTIEIIVMDWNPQGEDDDLVKASIELTEEMLNGEEQVALLEVQQEAGAEAAEGRRAVAEAFSNPQVTSGTVEFGQGDACAQLNQSKKDKQKGRFAKKVAKEYWMTEKRKMKPIKLDKSWGIVPGKHGLVLGDWELELDGSLELATGRLKAYLKKLKDEAKGLYKMTAADELTVYNNGRGALTEKNKNDVMLPESPKHKLFYEFDMVDSDQKAVRITNPKEEEEIRNKKKEAKERKGMRHAYRIVLDVDKRGEIQVAWVSTAHYSVGKNQKKKGWLLVKGIGLIQ